MNRSRSILKALAYLSAGLVLVLSMSFAQASRSPGGSGSTSGGSGSTSGGSSGGDTIDAPDPKIDDSSGGSGDSSNDADDDSSESSHGGSGDSGDSKSDGGDDSGSSGGSGDSETSGGSDGHSGSGDSGTSGGSGDSGTSGGSGESGTSGGSGDSGTSGGSGDSGTSSGSSDKSGSGTSGSNKSGDDHTSTTPSSSGNSLTSVDGKSSPTSSSTASKVETHLEIAETEHGDRYVKGEVIVMSSKHDMASLISKRGLKIMESFSLASMGLNGYRVQVPSSADEQKILGQLHQLDPKSIATLNHIYVPARGVTTMQSVDTPAGNAALSKSTASSAVSKRTSARIGLVDAHVDSGHPLLKSVSVASRVFGLANAAEDNHGTAVASRIAEVAPGANLFVASVFSEMSSGGEIASVYAIAKGLEWLSVNKVPVINLSLTGPSNPILQEVTSRLVEKGFMLVAAVGNEGPHAPAQYPAAYEGVIGVTAVDDQEHVYLYANQGSYVDFAARGVNRVVATGSGKTETASGTSFAAPVIAVALARLLPRPDKQLAIKAESELEKQAKDLGEPGRDSVFGYGVIEPTPVD